MAGDNPQPVQSTFHLVLLVLWTAITLLETKLSLTASLCLATYSSKECGRLFNDCNPLCMILGGSGDVCIERIKHLGRGVSNRHR